MLSKFKSATMITCRGQSYRLLATSQTSQKIIRQAEWEDMADISDEVYESLLPANVKGKALALGQTLTLDEP